MMLIYVFGIHYDMLGIDDGEVSLYTLFTETLKKFRYITTYEKISFAM